MQCPEENGLKPPIHHAYLSRAAFLVGLQSGEGVDQHRVQGRLLTVATEAGVSVEELVAAVNRKAKE
jgi:hypothetical protein